MRIGLAFAAALAAAVFGVGQVQAAQMIFTETTTASGSLNGVTFTNALVTISGEADTGGIASPSAGIYVLAGIPLSLTVQGLGTANFTDNMQVVSNQNSHFVGFGDLTAGQALLGSSVGAANASYDLSTPFGPVTGNVGTGFPGTAFATDEGAFKFSSLPTPIDHPVSSTFEATLASVPEPSTWLLMIGGLGILGAMLRRLRAPVMV